ncbi:MAG TPA: TIGR02452 family protein, partial [Kofleriaceae bacterium]|nr:TIGR02452 family protein [Kofleriaceae bacterium]
IASIRKHGILKRERHHVHLSADYDTASKVGSRRGKAVVLVIDADAMVGDGHKFYRTANGVWLVEHVPTKYIELPDDGPLFAAATSTRAENDAADDAAAAAADAADDAAAAGTEDGADPGASDVGRPAYGNAGGNAAGSVARGQRIAIAKATLAACDAGFYTNAAGARVEIGDQVEDAAEGTVMYDKDLVARVPIAPRFQTRFAVTAESTLVATTRLERDGVGHVGCLNFASAKRPGGGFLGGSQAQEESLARASSLYVCLRMIPEYYEQNIALRSALYLDLVLFSPFVPFIRDDDGAWLDRPVLASVITAAAPNASALRQNGKYDAAVVESTLRARADLALAAAAQHGVERYVLGAWGAGVFGNDPSAVAVIFADLLRGRYAGVFSEVVFAVLGGAGRPNYDAFARVFASS